MIMIYGVSGCFFLLLLFSSCENKTEKLLMETQDAYMEQLKLKEELLWDQIEVEIQLNKNNFSRDAIENVKQYKN